MITDPKKMPELMNLERRVQRLYGLGRISIEQHNVALILVKELRDVLHPNKEEANASVKEAPQTRS